MTDIVPYIGSADPVEGAIGEWLDAKYQRSRSQRTRHIYKATLRAFRDALRTAGYDLTSDARYVAQYAERWLREAIRPNKDDLSPATFNQRRAILSSFYTYLINHEMFGTLVNPISRIGRATETGDHGARPINADVLMSKMADIDRRRDIGMRDYALIWAAVFTGRRASEIANMNLGDLSIDDRGVTIQFPRLKGDKRGENLMPYPLATALVSHLEIQDKGHWQEMPDSTPVWRSLSYHGLGERLTVRGISNVFLHHLGVSAIHSTRHTFAVVMYHKLKVPLDVIQRMLGHSSIAITERYIKQLGEPDDSEHIKRLAEFFGFKGEEEK